MVKKLPGNYPLHKVIATGGKPSQKQTTKGVIVRKKSK